VYPQANYTRRQLPHEAADSPPLGDLEGMALAILRAIDDRIRMFNN